jgi:dolichyl-phosphate-mannose-protein mannosyltransferase
MRAFVTRHELLSVGLVLLLGLLVRLPAVPVDLHAVNDVRWFMDWGRMARDLGFTAVSDRIPDGVGLYPPLSLWILDILASVESLVPPEMRGGDTLLISLVKLLPVAADLCLAALVAWLVRGRGPVIAVVGAASIALNPAFIYLGAVWGQIDSLYSLMLVVSTALLARTPTTAAIAGAWTGWVLAALVKIQGLLLLPLVLVVSVRDAGWRRALVGAALAAVITVVLFLPWLPDELRRYFETISRVEARTTVNALNAWYVVGLGRRGSDVHRIIGPLTPRLLGYGLVLLVAGFVAAVVWVRRPRVGLALPAAVLAMAPFMVMTGMRGRYLLVVLPFLILLALGWDRRRVLPHAGLVAVLVVITQTINLMGYLPPDPSWWPRFTDPGTGSLVTVVRSLALLSAVCNVLVFGWLLVSLGRAARRPPNDSMADPKTPASPGPATATIDG